MNNILFITYYNKLLQTFYQVCFIIDHIINNRECRRKVLHFCRQNDSLPVTKLFFTLSFFIKQLMVYLFLLLLKTKFLQLGYEFITDRLRSITDSF